MFKVRLDFRVTPETTERTPSSPDLRDRRVRRAQLDRQVLKARKARSGFKVRTDLTERIHSCQGRSEPPERKARWDQLVRLALDRRGRMEMMATTGYSIPSRITEHPSIRVT